MEELYRQLYEKYSPGLSEEELNTKLQFASEQDPDEWVNAFYQKYTGSGPSEEQSNYISNYINQPKQPSNREKIMAKEEEPSFWDKYSPFAKADKLKSMNDALLDIDGEYNQEQINNIIKNNNNPQPISDFTKDFNKEIEDRRVQFKKDNNGEEPNAFEDTKMAFGAFKNHPKQALLTAYESLVQNTVSLYSGDARAVGISTAIAGANEFRKGKKGKISTKAVGFLGSMYSLAQGQVDAAYALDELIMEELGEGYTGKDLQGLMENKELFNKMRRASLIKGGTTAVVDKLAMKLTVKAGPLANRAIQQTIGKTAPGVVSKTLGIAGGAVAAVGVEGTAGAFAEAVGSVAKDTIGMGMTMDEALAALDGVELAGEFIGEGVVGGPVAAIQAAKDIGPSKYTLNGKEHGQADFMELTGGMTDEEIAQVDFDVTNNSAILDPLTKRRADGIIKNNLDTRVTDQGDRDTLFKLESELQELESKGSVTQSQKNEISNKKSEIKDITNTYFEKNKGLEENKQTTNQQVLKKAVGSDIAEAMGGNQEVLQYDEVVERFGEKAGRQAGFIDAETGKVIVNKTVAIDAGGNLNVAGHEFIHQALNARLNGKDKQASEAAQKAIESFKQKMAKDNADIHAMVLDNFKQLDYSNEEVSGVNADEYLAQLSDLMSKDKSIARKIQGKGRIESFIDSVKDLISDTLGIPKAELNFKTADDVTDFMIAHNKAFQTGKTDARFKKFTSKKIASTGKRKFSKVNLDGEGTLENKINALAGDAKTKAEFQGPNGNFGKVYEAIVFGDLDRLITNVNSTQRELVREELAIRLAGRPKTAKKIAELEAKGIDPLAGYDPAKAKLFKWFGSNIAQSKMVANKALFKDSENKGPSLDEAKKNAEGDSFATQIEDTTELLPDEILDKKLADERKAKQAPVKVKETLRRKMGFERNGDVHNKIKKAVSLNILRKMNIKRKPVKAEKLAGVEVDKDGKISETLDITDLRWQKEISRALGLDLQETMYDVMGRSTVDYTNFLDKFIVEAFEMMDQNLINNRYKDLVVKVVDRQGSTQSSLDKKVKSKTAGNALFEKLPKTKEELVEYFLKRGRKESLAQVLGTEFAHDATMEVLAEPEIMSKAEQVLVNKNNLKNQALTSLIAKQIGRDSKLKFSKVLDLDQKAEFVEKSQPFINLIKGFPVNRKNIINALAVQFPNWDAKTLNSFAGEIINPISRYLDPKLKNKGIKNKNIDPSTFIFESLNLKINKQNDNINKITGNKESFRDLFFNDDKQANVKENLKNYFLDSMSKEVIIDGKKTKVPITNDKEVIKVLQGLMLHKSHNTVGGKNFKKRYQSYSSAKDFYDNTFAFIPNVTVVGTKTKQGMSYAIHYKGVKVNFPPAVSQSTKLAVKGKRVNKAKAWWVENYNDYKESAKRNFDEVNRYLAYVAKIEDTSVKAMMIMSMKQGMGSMLKSAARVEYHYEGNYKGELMFEHMVPTEKALFDLLSFHSGNKKYTLKQIQDQYVVAIIPKTMDNNINVIFNQDRLSSFDYITDDASLLYYNPATFGYTNMYAMKSISGEGEVIGEQWSNFKGKINSKKNQQALNRLNKIQDIRNNNYKFSKTPDKGMSIFDFDDTLAQSNSMVGVKMPDGKKRKINATEFAIESADLEAAGATFDFSEFNKVIDGKKGPFFDLAQQINSKFGSKEIYVLTARPQEASYAIHAFLKGMGLNIPLENITGLEDGKASAKADWVIAKVADGYNNILFADDAIKNVKAVKEVLEIAEVKNDVRQAKLKFSKTLDENFNTILEKKSGINKNEEYSKAAGKAAGLGKGKYKFWMPPSAEDFMGLMYNILPSGEAGNKSLKFLTQALIDPYWAGTRSLNAAKQALGNDFSALKKRFPKAFKSLLKDVGHKQYSNEQAIRVYLWNKAGFEIPGMSKVDIEKLSDIVRNSRNMRGFADLVGATTKLKEGYIKPGQDWVSGTIAYDYFSIAQKTNRKKFLASWIERKNEIFSEKNMNKLEAIYGEDYRSALEDILWRMENGTNRTTGKNKLVNSWMNWVNNSVGAIMFFNSRSAILQTISMINFINWSDNNPLKAGMAFANQPQFWSDFSMIFNSDMLKQRRSGLQSDVNEAEIAQAVAGKTDKASAAISYLLKKGFLPTQMADSFAISMGGASFFRNRFNTYKSQGMTEAQAKDKAFGDFAKTSEESQQSADPALISQQQAGPLGRLILAFQNTPMQYARLIKKAVLDIKNGRGDVKTNISKIIYYGVIQNIIFSTLQSGLFALAFDDEEDEKLTQKLEDKKLRALNTSIDSLLRGGGVYGAGISTIKNMILQFNAQNDKDYRADHAYTMIEAINLSPPIGSKVRKIYSATQTYKFNKKVIPEMGMSVDNPAFLAIANVVSASTNIPLDRAIMKVNNVMASLDSQNKAWQRVATFLGWNTWDVGVKNEAVEKVKARLKKTSNKRKTKYRK